MNIQQKTEVASLRSQGFGYTKIAQALGLSKNTVKSYCKRNNLSGAALENTDMPILTPSFCLECGKVITKGMLFCPACGTKLAQPEEAADSETPAEAAAPAPAEAAPEEAPAADTAEKPAE